MPLPFIVVRGKQVPLVGDPGPGCVQYAESKLEFTPMNTRCMSRVGDPTLITVHNKGGEGSGAATYRFLKGKRLSVEFAVDPKTGLIYQYCDPAVLSCAHMGAGNSRSIGIEVSNTVIPFDDPATADNERRLFLRGLWTRLYRGRGQHVEQYRQYKRRVLSHFPAEKRAVKSLVLTLLQEFPSIPRVLPRQPDLTVDGLTKRGAVHGDRLDAEWQGVAGHLHFQESGYVNAKAHVDPALDVFDDLVKELA